MIRKNTQPIEGKSIERRSVTSHYHGSKISGCQQSFFDSEGHLHCRTSCRFAPVCNHAEENHTCQRFRSFYRLGPRFVEDPRLILLPWQRDKRRLLSTGTFFKKRFFVLILPRSERKLICFSLLFQFSRNLTMIKFTS